LTNIEKLEEQIRKCLKLNFLGTYAELHDEVNLIGRIAGEWRNLGDRKQYRADTGAVLNWWQPTGSVGEDGRGNRLIGIAGRFFEVPHQRSRRVRREHPVSIYRSESKLVDERRYMHDLE